MFKAPTPLRRLLDSLIFRLVVFGVTLMLLGTTGRVVFVTATLKQSVQDLVTAHLVALGQYVAGDIDSKVRSRQQLLEQLAAELTTELAASRGRPTVQLNQILARHHALAPLFSAGLVVVPVDGRGVLAQFPSHERLAQQDFSRADWWPRILAGAEFAVGAPSGHGLMASGEGTPSVWMAAPILAPGGTLVAVLVGATAIDTPGFLNQVQKQVIGDSGGFLLADPNSGRFVASTLPVLRLQPVPAPGVNALHDRAMAGWRGSGVTVNAFGVEEVVAVTDVPTAGWFLVSRMPTAEAFEPVYAIRGYIIRNVGPITLVVVLGLGVMLTLIFRPLKQAARQMRRMAEGEIPMEPLPVARHDEVGEMVAGFNHLLLRLQESENRLSHLAHHDPLTGLPNRRALLDRMQQAMALAKRQQTRLALLFVDIDGFKPVNDAFGHDVGDALLQVLATRLTQHVRQADVVARLGGDEFVVLLNDVDGPDSVATVAAKLVDALSQPCDIRYHTVQVGASIGFALYPDQAVDMDEWLALADRAMYQAKRSGRKTVQFADGS